jgi:glycosyltransferase involved in cell wall biosynthesis
MKLNLVTVLNSSGYGMCGLNLLRALNAADCEVALFVLPAPGFELMLEVDDLALVRRALKRAALYDMRAPCLRLASEGQMTLFAGRGPRLGLTFYETDELTPRERHHLATLDVLFVSSNWARLIALEQKVAAGRIVTLPMAVDTQYYYPGERAPGPDTIFLHVGKWEHRKGQDILLEAFEQAFEPDEAVRLQFMSDNPFLGERNAEWQALCRASRMSDRIDILPRVLYTRQVADIMRAADCGVFTPRSEGWNLELLEMMACGKAVIACNFAGHTEFATHDNCRLIELPARERVSDDRWMKFYSTEKVGQWGSWDETARATLVEHMRKVHHERLAGTLQPNLAGLETARYFSWERAARIVMENCS